MSETAGIVASLDVPAVVVNSSLITHHSSLILMRYHHRFTVHAPLARVRDFHRRSQSMGQITPPPVWVKIHQAPELLSEGNQMDFTMWLGPLPIRWVARIEAVSETGFVDRQLRGPFRQWVHTHSFRPIDAEQTEVIDQVEVELGRAWAQRLIGYNMWLSLPVLFAFRQWKTKRLLE